MGIVKKAELKKIETSWKRASSVAKRKPMKPYELGKQQVQVETVYLGVTKTKEPVIKYELKILTGADKGRTVKRTQYLSTEKFGEDETTSMDKTKQELAKLGLDCDALGLEAIIESLEDAVIEVDMWMSKKPNAFYPTPFFRELIESGSKREEVPEEEEKLEEGYEYVNDDDFEEVK